MKNLRRHRDDRLVGDAPLVRGLVYPIYTCLSPRYTNIRLLSLYSSLIVTSLASDAGDEGDEPLPADRDALEMARLLLHTSPLQASRAH